MHKDFNELHTGLAMIFQQATRGRVVWDAPTPTMLRRLAFSITDLALEERVQITRAILGHLEPIERQAAKLHLQQYAPDRVSSDSDFEMYLAQSGFPETVEPMDLDSHGKTKAMQKESDRRYERLYSAMNAYKHAAENNENTEQAAQNVLDAIENGHPFAKSSFAWRFYHQLSKTPGHPLIPAILKLGADSIIYLDAEEYSSMMKHYNSVLAEDEQLTVPQMTVSEFVHAMQNLPRHGNITPPQLT